MMFLKESAMKCVIQLCIVKRVHRYINTSSFSLIIHVQGSSLFMCFTYKYFFGLDTYLHVCIS